MFYHNYEIMKVLRMTETVITQIIYLHYLGIKKQKGGPL